MSDIKYISSRELKKCNNVDPSSKAKAFTDKTFWYYTSMETAVSILTSNNVWVRSINEMNDKSEAELHSTDGSRIHALCFCNSSTEKIPMWYLYSGMLGKGISIGFTPGNLLDLLKSLQTVKGIDKETHNVFCLKKGEDFDLELGWIFYAVPSGRIKYKGKWFQLKDSLLSFTQGNYFVKDYPWEYEKEFRLVFKNKTSFVLDHLEIEILESCKRKLKLCFAPEWEEKDRNSAINHCISEGISKDKISESSLNIKMSLFERNKKDILNYVAEKIKVGKYKEEDLRALEAALKLKR